MATHQILSVFYVACVRPLNDEEADRVGFARCNLMQAVDLADESGDLEELAGVVLTSRDVSLSIGQRLDLCAREDQDFA